jgi:hypothetical protein
MPIVGSHVSCLADRSFLAIDTQDGYGQTGKVSVADSTGDPLTVLESSSSTIDGTKRGVRHGGTPISGSSPGEGTRATFQAEMAFEAKESTPRLRAAGGPSASRHH